MASLADRLRELMNERRPPITQHGLADMVGVTQPAVAGWLEGAVPYPKTLNRICRALGVRRDWLMYGEGEKYAPNKAEELPPTYSRRDKLMFIEEQAPELLPLVDAFLDSVQKQLGVDAASKPPRKTRGASSSGDADESGSRASR